MRFSCNKTFWVYLASAVLALMLLAYGVSLVEQIRDTRQAWVSYSERAVLADEAMHQFSDRFGYGGFIHKFKNFVLRRDEQLIPRLEQDLELTRQAIVNYRELALTQKERQALVQLRAVVETYAQQFQMARRLMQQGLSPGEIDLQVRVDDTPAIQAIATLNELAEFHAIDKRRQMGESLEDVIRQIAFGGGLIILVVIVAVVLVRDHRRLAQATDSIAQTRRYFIELLEAAPDAIMVADEQGRIIRANIQAERLFGYPRDELLGKHVEELMPERFRHAHVAVRDRAFDSNRERPMRTAAEFLILTREGRELPVEISISYSLQGDGKQAILSLRDVSERKEMERVLNEQHENLQMAQAMTHLGSWDWDLKAKRLAWSDEVYRIFGFEPQSFPISYDAFLEKIHPSDCDKVVQAVNRALTDDEPYDIEHRVLRKDGAERIVREQGQVFHDALGEPVRMVGTVQDITEQKAYERALRLDQAIIDHISQPIVITDNDLNIIDVNQAFSDLTGYAADELIGSQTRKMKSGRHDAAYYKAMWDAIKEHNKWQGEMWLRRKDGEAIHRLLAITRVCDEELDTCRYVGLYSDITQLKQHEAELEQLAHFDQLTGLANRMLCHDRLRAAIARATRSHKLVAVMYIDLDGFKAINDRLGHQAGDLLLVEAAKRMRGSVREDDTVARLGGDEFAVVLNEVDNPEEAAMLGNRLLKRLRIHMGDGASALTVSASIGIAVYPQDGDRLNVLLEHADQAMYHAKQAGKDTLAFYRNADS